MSVKVSAHAVFIAWVTQRMINVPPCWVGHHVKQTE